MVVVALETEVQAEIQDPHGLFELDDTVQPCDGEVDGVSSESVLATVHPSALVCPHCLLDCTARFSL